MKKILTIGLVFALVAGVAVVLYFPTPHFVLTGWLRREAFFDGKPTGFWVSALKNDPFVKDAVPEKDIGKYLREGGAAAIPVLNEMLGNEDVDIRRQVLVTLAVMGPERKEAIAALEKLLTVETDTMCLARAADILTKTSPETAISAFARAMRENPDPRTRTAVARIIGRTSLTAKDAVEPLTQALADRDPHVRLVAAWTLWQITQDVKPLLATLLDGIQTPDKEVGRQALTFFRQMKIGKEAISVLVQAITNQDQEIRWRAIQALASLCREKGPAGLGSYSGLEMRLPTSSETEFVRAYSHEVAPLLVSALKNGPTNVRMSAISVLAAIEAKEAVPTLLALLSDESQAVQGAAISALGKLKASEAAVPILIKELKNKSKPSHWVIQALGDIGPGAVAAVPILIEALNEKDASAARALGLIGKPAKQAIPALHRVLKDSDLSKNPVLSFYAAISLWQIDPNNNDTVPFLNKAIKHPMIRLEAVLALWRIQGQSYPVTSVLCDMIKKNTLREERNSAIWAIPPLGHETELRLAVRGTRNSAILAIPRLGPLAKAAVPTLIEVVNEANTGQLSGEEIMSCVYAAQVLGKIGGNAKAAIPVLVTAAKNENASLKEAAINALMAIDPKKFNRSTGYWPPERSGMRGAVMVGP